MQKHPHFLLFLIILSAIGTFFVMKPFLLSIFLAFILSTLFSKTNKKLAKKLNGHKSWSSLIMCLWVMLILIIPFFIITALMISEADSLIKEMQNKNISFDISTLKNLPIVNTFNLDQTLQSNEGISQIAKSTQNISNYLFTAIKAVYTSASNFIFILVVCFFALYYFFKDGDSIIKKIMDLSPLPSNQEKELFEKFNTMTIATIKGTLIIALIQGILMGITFWIAGVQAPTLWGLLTALISIIPLLGAFLIWLPVGLVLLALSYYWQGIFVLIIGAVIISSIDNFLRPKLIEGQTSLHPLLVFLATIGGIVFFGPLGFVVGPVLVTLLISLLEIYQTGHVQNPVLEK